MLFGPRTKKIRSRVIRNQGLAERGFTLIELMIALAMLAISLLGTESVIISIARNRATARKMSVATNLCQAKIEELKSLGYGAVVNCIETNLNEKGLAGGIFNRYVSVSEGPVPRTKTVWVIVWWRDFDFRKIKTVSMRTMIADL
ncbi:MAG: type II secretion system GspH family protein [bacterium]|nr:type II secretion system GspH family protein [bacterium]